MRLIDADSLQKQFKALELKCRKMLWSGGELNEDCLRAVRKMIDDAPTIDPSPNDPLTLEQLREMDGEPVWVVSLDGRMNRWAFVWAYWEHVRYFTVRNNVVCEVIGSCFKIYGKTWIAYRRKPEDAHA